MGFKRTVAGIGIGIGVVGAGLVGSGMLVGSAATLFLTPKDGPTMRRLAREKLRAGREASMATGRSIVDGCLTTGRNASRKVVSFARGA